MKRIFVLMLVLALAGMGWGAMTRDQVLWEVNNWHQANNEYSARAGFNVYTPYGDQSDEWLCWMNTLLTRKMALSVAVPSTVVVDYTYRITIGATNIDYKALTTSGVTVCTQLIAAWNASESADCTPITAIDYTVGLSTLYLVADVPGTSFTVTLAVLDGSMTPVTTTMTQTARQTLGTTYAGYCMYEVFKCKIKAGYYMALNKTIVNASAGPIWEPAIAGAEWGAGKDITNANTLSLAVTATITNLNGFTGLYTTNVNRVMTLKVPADTTRLYVVGVAKDITGTSALTVATASGTATITDASVNFDNPGDLTAYGEQMFPDYSEISGWDGYPHYQSVCLISTNCGGATLTLTPNFDSTNYLYLIGFIAINDNASAQPDTGVVDPTSIEYIMPFSYDSRQVDTFTPASIAATDIFTLTVTGTDLSTHAVSVTATNTSATTTSGLMIDAWNSQTNPLCTSIHASGTSTVILTSMVSGGTFSVASSITNVSGGGAPTFARAATVVGGSMTAYNQSSDGPLYVNIAGGTEFFWGNGHFTATNTLVSPTYTVYGDTSALCSLTPTTYSPPAEKTWTRTVYDSVTMTGTGTISLDIGAGAGADIADAGNYTVVHQYTSSGMAIFQKWLFNTNVDAEGAEVSLDADMDGGYVSQWSLDNQFTRYLRIPTDTSYQLVGDYGSENSNVFASNITTLYRLDPTHGIAAIFDCGFSYYAASAKTSATKPIMTLLKNVTGDYYSKAYLSPFETDTDIAIAENDEIISYQKRQVLPSTSVGDAYTAAGGSLGKSTPFGSGSTILGN
jgi:hypothetical protein